MRLREDNIVRKLLFWTTVIAFAALFLGCTTNTSQPEDVDTSDIQALIQAEDSLFSLESFADSESDSFIVGGRFRAHFSGPVLPWFVRRTVSSWDRSIDVEPVTNDSAIATLTTQAVGTLHIGVDSDTSNNVRVDTVWNKPFGV